MSSLYKNGEWWYYQTVITLPDGSKRKIQKSLKTKDKKVGQKKQKELDSKYCAFHPSRSRVSVQSDHRFRSMAISRFG